MACLEFIVLYTHQKTKKAKIWQDGFLRMVSESNKASLFDDKGQCLDSVFLKVGKVCPGDDLESDRYLITVEAEKSVENDLRNQFGKQEVLTSNISSMQSTCHSQRRLAVGLKRKSTGFHGPRSITCKAPEPDNLSSSSPPTKRPCTAFPSQFYTTSPLFSASYGNNVKTNLAADFSYGVGNLAPLPDEGHGLTSASILSPACVGSVEKVMLHGQLCIAADSAASTGQAKYPTIALQTVESCRPSGGMAMSQNIRSKAQILALLKSKPQSLGADMNASEISDRFSKHKGTSTAVHLDIVVGNKKENMQQEHPHGDLLIESVSNKSKWDVYLPQSTTDSSYNNGNVTVVEETNQDQGNCLDGSLPLSCFRQEVQHSTGSCQPYKMFGEDADERLVFNNQSQSCKAANLSPLRSAPSIGGSKASMLSGCNDLYRKCQEENDRPSESNLQTKPETPSVSASEVFSHEESRKNNSNTFLKTYPDLCNTGVLGDLKGVEAWSCSEDNEEVDAPSDNRQMPRKDAEKTFTGRKLSGCAGISMKEECIILDNFSDTDEEFSEITFNLLDNLDFDPTEEEDSQETSKSVQCSAGMSRVMPCKDEELTSVRHAEEMRCNQKKDCFPKSRSLSENELADSVSGTPLNEETLPSPHNAEAFVGVGGSAEENEASLVDFSLLGTESFAQKTKVVNIQITGDNEGSQHHSNFGVNNSLSMDDGHYRKSAYTGETEYECESTEAELISYSPMSVNLSTVCQESEEDDVLVNSNSPLEGSLRNSSECDVPLDDLVVELALDAKAPDSLCRLTMGKPDVAIAVLARNEKAPLVSETCKLALAGRHVFPNEVGDWAGADISSVLPNLGNGITVLRSLAEHSTAFESLKLLEEEHVAVVSEKNSVGLSCDQARDREETKTFRNLKDDDSSSMSSLHHRFRTLVPIITAPSADALHDIKSHPDVDCVEENHICSDPLEINWNNQSVGLPVNLIMPEDIQEIPALIVEYTVADPVELACTESEDATEGPRQSKWLKYQSTAQSDSVARKRDKVEMTDGVFAENVFGTQLKDNQERDGQAGNYIPPESEHLKIIKDILGKQHGLFTSQDFVSSSEILPVNSKQPDSFNKTQSVFGKITHYNVTGDNQNISIAELSFPSETTVKNASLPKRQVLIPATFQSPAHYKQVFAAALTEHLNILLFSISQRFHKVLAKADLSFYTSGKEVQRTGKENHVPFCLHNQPTKLVMVKKEGPNKGRFFFTCDAPKANQCKFFKWLEEVKSSDYVSGESNTKVVFCDIKSVGAFVRCQRIFLYEECQLLVRKAFDFQRQFGKYRKNIVESEFAEGSKNKLYLKLSKKENSSVYSKDDLWVVSKTLNFDPLDTFIACSAFFGPSAISEVELLPLKGYYPSNWPGNMIVHALLVCNASSELTTLRNIQEHFNPATLPLMPYLLNMSAYKEHVGKVSRRKFIPPAMNINTTRQCGLLSSNTMLELAEEMIHVFHLNSDQAAALVQIGQMMTSSTSVSTLEKQEVLPITVIHGVFGAGKSYLLAVIVLFVSQLFESSEAAEGPRQTPWKLLISSSTNVAVDRVLLGLLDLGFDKFIRVGSIRKIAKPILPYSLHAGSGSENEQLKELLALMKENLTPAEKVYVRKSIEQHKLGTNKQLLGQVRVVGVTCAACPFPCLNKLRFPVVVLDECSQITEPACLLPIARFECEKLVLVGDPKQLPPTIQGSECAHEKGLEQTLFGRLCLMGHEAIMLRTQYRCHPALSSIVNDLFYKGWLVDGVTEADRSPLLDWLPTLCFYNVKGTEQIEQDNSFYNMEEATFTCKLIQTLIASGIDGCMIGVITLYKSQMYKLCGLLSGAAVLCDPLQIKAVHVSTVDAFQGAEKEIIVLSCVRTRQVGFIDSEKRMTVALTRGKRHLLIVGNAACLRKNNLWGSVIHHCEEKENGLKHVSQYEDELNKILKSYMEREKEEDTNSKKRQSKKKS